MMRHAYQQHHSLDGCADLQPAHYPASNLYPYYNLPDN